LSIAPLSAVLIFHSHRKTWTRTALYGIVDMFASIPETEGGLWSLLLGEGSKSSERKPCHSRIYNIFFASANRRNSRNRPVVCAVVWTFGGVVAVGVVGTFFYFVLDLVIVITHVHRGWRGGGGQRRRWWRGVIIIIIIIIGFVVVVIVVVILVVFRLDGYKRFCIFWRSWLMPGASYLREWFIHPLSKHLETAKIEKLCSFRSYTNQ